MFGLRNLGSSEKSIIERMVFYWGILGLEAFLLIEGYFHYMEGSFPLIEGFGDRVIFTLFEIFYLHPVIGSYYIYRKNCIEIPVPGKFFPLQEACVILRFSKGANTVNPSIIGR